MDSMTERSRVRLLCPCGHIGSILVVREGSKGERYFVEGFFGEQNVYLGGSPSTADMLSAVQPSCPMCKRALTVSDVKSVSGLVG
jgi:hypothetical protein